MSEPSGPASPSTASSADEAHPDVRSPADPGRRAWAVVVGVVTAAVYLPAVASVGLRTDTGAHLRFAESMALTGREYGPYYLFEQLTVIVRALIPFGALGRLHEPWGERATTWDVAGVVVVVAFVVLLAEVVYQRFVATLDGANRRVAAPVGAVLALLVLLVTPITVLTWNRHQLLTGYVNITSYENPTVNVVRPLALVLFWLLIDRFSGRARPRVVAVAAALSFLALAAKPSYTICLLPAMALLAAWSLLRRRPVDWRLLLLGFVGPSVLGLAFQFWATRSLEGGVGVAPFKIVRQLLESRGLSPWMFVPLLVLSILFPAVVAAAYWKRGTTTLSWVMAWVTFGVGLAVFCLLTITGRRDYGDFVWGAQIALFVLFVESVRLVLPEVFRPGRTRPEGEVAGRRRVDLRVAAVTVAFVLHLVCGGMLWYHEVVTPAAWW
jgi:hypothetical protein